MNNPTIARSPASSLNADDIHPVLSVASRVADALADPRVATTLAAGRTWWPHHLAHGALGIVLLHAERAASGLASWQRVHDWLAYAARTPVTSGPDSHLMYGAPALAFVLATVAEHQPGPYEEALKTLDATIAKDAILRVGAHHRRLSVGDCPMLADFDAVRGVTGLGAYLLRRTFANAALTDSLTAVLSYLVRLTEPTSHHGMWVPGWWTEIGPNGVLDASGFPGGHANFGVAHGIAGPLAFLALAARAGFTVPGQTAAIDAICAWLDEWRIDTPAGPVWPYWVTWEQQRVGPPATHPHPQRPSWCYGTAGLARAQQLAAVALCDNKRKHRAEAALIQALIDPAHRAATTDSSLCHGFAGMAHIAVRTAIDAGPETGEQLWDAAQDLLDAVHDPDTDPARTARALLDPAGPGLLEGAAGVALAVQSPGARAAPRTCWDSSLIVA